MVRAAVLSLMLAGCLSTPPPAGQDDGGPIDASNPDAMESVCGRDPRPATACNASGDFDDQPFAPVGAVVSGMMSDDLNADGQADLLIADNNGATPGIWILLGPIDFDAPRYHAFVSTGIEIGAFDVGQLLDVGSCPDLTVFGKTGTEGVAQIWRYDGSAGMFATPPLERGLAFDPQFTGGPVTLEWARLRPIGDDLLVADIAIMRAVRVGGDFENFAAAGVEIAYAEEGVNVWTDINGISAARTAGCEIDRVLVAEQHHAKWLPEGSVLVGGPAIEWPAPDNITRGTRRVDLDHLPPDDVFTTGSANFGAYLLAYDGDDDVAMTPVAAFSGYAPPAPDFQYEAFTIGDLGGTADPEFAAIDLTDTPAPQVILVDSVRVVGTLMSDGANAADLPAGFLPYQIVIADLSETTPGNEAWMITPDGDLRCFARSAATQTLLPCE